jgi:hypothetical protein
MSDTKFTERLTRDNAALLLWEKVPEASMTGRRSHLGRCRVPPHIRRVVDTDVLIEIDLMVIATSWVRTLYAHRGKIDRIGAEQCPSSSSRLSPSRTVASPRC